MSPSSVTLTARALTIAAGSRLLIDHLDLTVAAGMRIGLVGPNGSGKSTLLRTLAGLHPAERGTVTRAPKTATVGYLPQEAERRSGETVAALLARRTGVAAASADLDASTADLATGEPRADDRYATALERWLALGGADLESRAPTVLASLGLPDGLLHRPTVGLSGGQAARVQLAALLLARFDVLLLDEPTNDLDDDGLTRLEAFAAGISGPLVVVSHDRAFLERTVTAVVEIDPHTRRASRYEGGWRVYLEERARVRSQAEEAWERYQQERAALRERAQRQRQWAAQGVRTALRRPDDNDKSIRWERAQGAERMAMRARKAEDALSRLDPVEKPWEGWQLRFGVATTGRSGDVVARLIGAVVERGSFRLGPVDLEINWGDRLAITGANGAGKSTLLAAVLGRVPLAAGDRWFGPSVAVGEIEQGRDRFAAPGTLLDRFLIEAGQPPPAEARRLLATFGLGADQVVRPSAGLSPGERTRATLAVLQARGVNCVVLDEPTNHLDLEAIEQLEQALASFPGTLLVVTHDRRLREALAIKRFVDVDAGRVNERRA